MLAALQHAIDALDEGHSQRVTEMATSFARWLHWDEVRLKRLELGARLHDVGKLLLPAPLLAKAGPLDDAEFEQVRQHPLTGAAMVEPYALARLALSCILHHHERWDGEGYPSGLVGGEAPIEARIVAICDAFDAMTTPRPYRETLGAEHALAEIARCGGTQFDPEIAEQFLLFGSDQIFDSTVALPPVAYAASWQVDGIIQFEA